MNNHSIQFNNTTIFYRTTGDGYPVCLLHGFGEDGSIWDRQLSALPGYRLIIPDIPGSGKSSLLKKEGAGIDDYAAIIKSVAVHENINEWIMIGHSMGGYIILAFEEKFPGLLKSFGLFHSSAYKDDDEKIATRLKAIEFIDEHGAMAFLKTSTPNLFHDASKHETEIRSLLHSVELISPEALKQYYKAMIGRPDRVHVLQSASKPVFFILGKHDKAVPFTQGLSQCHVPGRAFVHILRDSAHMGMLEETWKSNECLRNILHTLVVN